LGAGEEDLTVGTEASTENAAKVARLLENAPAVEICMCAGDVFTLIAMLQLTLRCPQFRKELPRECAAAKYLVHRLSGALPIELLPAIAAGFDPGLDRSPKCETED
jgi:hypothetical protein